MEYEYPFFVLKKGVASLEINDLKLSFNIKIEHKDADRCLGINVD